MNEKILVQSKEAVPAPAEVRGYLLKTGWLPQPDHHNYQVFTKKIGGEDAELYTTTNDKFIDYNRRIGELLIDLSLLEKRSSAEILRDIRGICVPYIGITDFTSPEQILETAALIKGTGRKIQAGVMISYKTLNGLLTKWEGIWPDKSEIENIFVKDNYVMNCLHYADYEGVDVLRSLIEATYYGGKNMDALQLDMIWPDPRDIRAYRIAFPGIKLILQVGSQAFEQINNSEEELIARLHQYPIDYVLLDLSGGRGIEMNIDGLRPFVQKIQRNLRFLGIAIAGGLGPHNVSLLTDFVKEFPDISIDAQSKLRPSGNSMDALDMGMAKEYVTKTIGLF